MRRMHAGRLAGEALAAPGPGAGEFPPPDQLVLREETVKVTLALGKDSVSFFKKQAKKQKVPYQRMIKNLVDRYAESYREA